MTIYKRKAKEKSEQMKFVLNKKLMQHNSSIKKAIPKDGFMYALKL